MRKTYGANTAVDGVSFAIDAGEVFGLLGPNGAGKSTTINIIATLLHADAGSVTACGIPSTRTDAYKRVLGYVPQEISLADRLTARENLHLVGRLYDLAAGALRARTDELLDLVGLRDRADDLVQTYSGGMKRRLNIAAALLHGPRLLLMDEPTAGVDPHARAYIFDLVERLASEGRAVLYTTHYMEEAQRLCRRTAIIDRGRILAMGTLTELTGRVAAKRDLALQGRGLTPASVAKLAVSMGGLPWTLDGDTAHLSISGSREAILAAARHAGEAGIEPTSIRLNEPNLETVFLKLTGRALRD
ncbi:MAG: export ABC transporter ATP-binding protein [Planctomycetota bacterium]|nr:MAG: export ABC transporter ATP-binding protein [Planctomycetota bacterium]